MAKDRETVVGVDVGSSKVAVAIAEVSEATPLVVGRGLAENGGMRKGVVVDIDATARAISAAVQEAQRMSGTSIRSATISISGAHLASLNNRGVVAVTRPDREIAAADVRRVLEAARVVHISPDREVLHIIPREFAVDGYDGVHDPEGMIGTRLEVEAHMITGAAASVQNLLKAVQRSGIEVDDVCVSALASAEAVLTPAERDLGVLLVDIGAGTTDLVLYDNGAPWFCTALPVGGGHLTADIAMGLRVPLPLAEEIKLQHACASAAAAPEESFEVPNPSGRGTREVPAKVLAGIVEPRAQEMIVLLAREIERSGYRAMIPSGLVLTGGGSGLRGLADIASELLDMPCRLAGPRVLGSAVAAEVSGPGFSTVVGLVQRGAHEYARTAAASAEAGGGAFFQRLRHWLRELF